MLNKNSSNNLKTDITAIVLTFNEEKHIERDTQGYLKDKIGTTWTGTGPAQADRIMRTATVARELPSLSNLVGDVSSKINEIIDCGELVLVEGTQGTFLSLYHGTYPYVTSKDVTASSICADVGIGPKRIDEVIKKDNEIKQIVIEIRKKLF